MANEPTFTQFFGANATQDANQFCIQKSDLVPADPLAYLFTPGANNRAEQTALALLLHWRDNQDRSPDSQFVIGGVEMSVFVRGGRYVRRYKFPLEIYIDDNFGNLPNPDDV